MFCEQCGSNTDTADTFCTACGANIAVHSQKTTHAPISDEQREMFRQALQDIGEGDLANKQFLTPVEVRRIQYGFARCAVDDKSTFNLAYSDSDIHALQSSKPKDPALYEEWHAWHFDTALTVYQLVVWVAAATAA